MRAFGWILGMGVPALLVAAACGSGSSAGNEPGGGDPGASGGGAGGPSYTPNVPEPPQGCVPAEEEDVPDDDFADTNCDGIDGDRTKGIFVDPLGSDAGDGTIEAPVATLKRAIELARESGKAVYVCTARYEETVRLEAASVSIFGGYDCGDGWKRKAQQATVAPAEGRPLTILDAESPLVVSRIKFIAPDASGVGASSIAALVVDSAEVQLRHVDLEAGLGSAGRDGVVAEAFSALPRAPHGRSAPLVANCYTYGAAPASCTQACSGGGFQICCGYTASSCPNDCRPQVLKSECTATISGIVGSLPSLPACPTDTGTTSRSFAEGGRGGNGYTGVQRQLGTQPTPAANAGQPGAPGGSASNGFGAISPDGEYLPTNEGTAGLYGKLGTAGRGGNGGNGWDGYGDASQSPRMSGAGGRGGARGCGGRPGEGGGGGGASIGLVSVRSFVQLERAVVRAAGGGAGGNPSAGGAGQNGGQPGLGGSNEKGAKTATDGQAGTAGGQGGAGGPGGGGPSIGIVAVEIEASVKATVFDIGPGGVGGTPVTGSGIAAGASGLSQDVHLIDVPPSEG